jgi:hypothetical protein
LKGEDEVGNYWGTKWELGEEVISYSFLNYTDFIYKLKTKG